MIWIDSALLWYASYRVCRNRCGWALLWEKLALAVIFALAVKSLFLFFLVSSGIRPTAFIQMGVSVLVLLPTLLLPGSTENERDIGEKTGLIWITLLGVGILFCLSMVNAWFFPVTESDATWYHIRGMSFFNEVRFDSEWVVPQLKQYPPFVPLLFTYLIAFDVEHLKVFFPVLYVCLIIIFYSRLLLLTENRKTACLFTMILATTPYFWWQSVLPFLDLTTAVFYSSGSLYWYSWIKNKLDGNHSNQESSYALAGGILLGLAAWTRIEFLLYDLVPVFLTVYVFSRYPEEDGNAKTVKIFFLSMLSLPSIWFLNLLTFDMVLWGQVKMLGGVCLFLWFFALGWTSGKWKFSEASVRWSFIVALPAYFSLLLVLGAEPIPVWKKIIISLYRTSTVHVFYLFTASLVIFLFFEKIKDLSEPLKLLGVFLLLFLCTHLVIFTYATPKWATLGEFVYATFIQPGNSVNLSDTRGMMSIYPVFIVFMGMLPFVKRRLEND
ncbi:MAG: hypothetical protein F3744_06895 [Nitrospinae bacterium]|nr:hypothetical protein [Nitrospinota bacterium]